MTVLVVDSDASKRRTVVAELEEQVEDSAIEIASSSDEAREQLHAADSLDCLVYVARADDDIDVLELQALTGETNPSCAVILVGGPETNDVATAALERGLTDFVPRGEGDAWLPALVSRVKRVMQETGGFADETEETLELLNEVTRELIAAETTHDVAVVTNEYANDVLGFPATSVRRYNPDIHALEVIQTGAQVGEETDRPPYPVDDSPHGKAFRKGEPVIDDLRGVEDDEFGREVFTQCMYVPIGEYGTISIGLTEGTVSTLDVKFAEILANNARVAFDEATRKEQLSSTLTEIDEFATQVVEASNSVSDAAVDVRSANERVVEAAEDISTGASEQSQLLQDATGEMESLLSVVDQVSELADEVATLSQESADLADEGNQRAQSGIDSMDEIKSQVEELVSEIDSLHTEINNVADIVEVIDDIAQQTNMLALNASIEAARADASGDGFAVVADEVKQLSTETKESTDEIREIVDRVTTQSEAVGNAILQMRSDITEGTATVEETVEALAAIQESVEETDDGVQDINQSVDQQASTVQDVGDIVDQVATISQETSEKTDTVAEVATDQSQPVDEVANRAGELRDAAQELRTLAADISSSDGGAAD